MKTQRFGKFALRTIPFLITAACATNAFAQEGMDEVVVSAQKRTERIQDVPMAISAISGQALENRKIEGAADLQGTLPNVNIVAAPVSGLIAASYIRGLGTGQPSIWMDPAVGMYVDGVFVGKNQGALFDMLDLERVEVLRGPQGTLFGRNTLGGAINFVTRKPSGQFSGNVGLEIGNYGRVVQKVSVDTPKVNDVLSLTIAARKEKQDGWLNNPAATDKWGNRDREAFKLNAKLDVSKDTKVYYSIDRSNINETTTPMSLIKATGYCSYLTSPMAVGCFQAYFDPGLGSMITPYINTNVPTSTESTVTPFQALKVTGHTFNAETAINSNNILKYIGSYRTMDYKDQADLDGTPVNVFSSTKDTKYKTQSHEVQIIGSANGFNYVGGLYYFKDEGTTIQNQIGALNGFNPIKPGHGQSNFGLGTDAKAIYGQVDYQINKDSTLTAGLRYTTEEKTGSVWRAAAVINGVGVPFNNDRWDMGFAPGDINLKTKFSATTPSVALSNKLNASTMVFGRIAKGFKSGGFPLEAKSTYNVPFEEETSTSYEAGIKGADSVMSYAATAFVTKLKNQQISYLPAGSTSPTTTNAGASTYNGLELEGAFKVTKDTKIQAGYGFLNSKFDKFMAADLSSPRKVVDVASNLVVGYAPRHTINLNVESYLAKTEYGRLKGLVEYRYTASYYNYAANKENKTPLSIPGNYAPDSKLPSLGTINARLTLDQIPVGGPGQADASIWVKNATNKQVLQNMLDAGGYYQVGYWSAPRTLGVSLNYKW